MLPLSRRTFLAGTGALLAAPSLARGAAPRWPALRALLKGYIAQGRVPGAALAILRPGAFRPEWIIEGMDAFEDGRPVTPDTLWRIYSMTKPLTGLIAMQLVASERLSLDQPIADILPEFATMRVLTDPETSLDAVPAKTPICLRHLLTHTAGFAYTINGNGPLEQEYRRLGLQPGSSPRFLAKTDGALPDLQTFARRLATLPLLSEPGTAWHYSVASDLLGALLERVIGQPLDQLMTARLFRPLGMDSTGFQIDPADKRHLSSNYAWVGTDGKPLDKPQLVDSRKDSDWLAPPAMLAGGAGLVASAQDYARYAQMMLNGGVVGSRPVIAPRVVRHSMSNLMPAGVFYDQANGFGASARLTLFDTLRLAPEGTPAGVYGWGGAAGTLFQVDPVRGIALVLMLQYLPQARFPLPKDLQIALNKDLA